MAASITLPARFGLAASLALAAGRLPASEPLSLAGGRLLLGGELSGTLAPDDPGFFTYNDYDHSLRSWRVSMTAQARAGDHLALLAELLSENADSPRAYALYLRVRPWTARSFDIQAGVIPPVFGSFARRRYGPDNPLIGLPLGYQYLTSLRHDALPATAEDLLEQRGQGWLVGYPIGNPMPAAGLPLVNALRWDTGVQVRIGSEPVELSVALTQGTLSNPRVSDDNDGKQLSARLAWQPLAGLVVGASGARGEYLARELDQELGPDASGGQHQTTWGVDLEYSGGYGLVRAEVIWSAWDLPDAAATGVRRPLRSTAFMAEGRYKLAPGFYLAARADHLDFGALQEAPGSPGWDAPVTRVEGGLGYSLLRNLLLKASYQYNRREAGPVLSDGLPAVQLVLWF